MALAYSASFLGGVISLLCLILLSPVLRYHRTHVEGRLAELEALVDPSGDPRVPTAWHAGSFLDRLDGLTDRLGTPQFSSFEIPPGDFPAVAELAVRNGSNGSNPQPMTEDDYLKILRRLG